jgi:negative regulator of sigma E activity
MRPKLQRLTTLPHRGNKGGPLAALAAAAFVALTAQAPAPNADELVRAATEAPKHISYVGEVQSTRWGASQALATIVRVEHKAPDDTRRTYLAPQAVYGEYTVTRGTKTFDFDVHRQTVAASENLAADNAVAYNNNIALVFANYTAVEGPPEAVAGRPSQTVSLINRHTGERMMRLWIDAQTKIVLAKESYHSDGSLATRMRFDEIRYTGDIPADIFSIDVPAGFATLPDRRFASPSTDIGAAVRDAGFRPVGPRYLPEGFSLISADSSEIKGVKSLHLLYSDGLRNLSLFENASDAAADFGSLRPSTTTFEGHDAQFVKDGPTTLLSWREHGIAFALVGDLDLHEMTAIAISVVP